MYYILAYIFYKEKMTGHGLGLQLYTFRASDYNKESKYMADNVWSRWIRFRCTVQNYLDGEEYIEPILDLEVNAASVDESEEIIQIYTEILGGPDSPDIRRTNGT
jgi:hypothetical protein